MTTKGPFQPKPFCDDSMIYKKEVTSLPQGILLSKTDNNIITRAFWTLNLIWISSNFQKW